MDQLSKNLIENKKIVISVIVVQVLWGVFCYNLVIYIG
jgi:hypothetical protein